MCLNQDSVAGAQISGFSPGYLIISAPAPKSLGPLEAENRRLIRTSLSAHKLCLCNGNLNFIIWLQHLKIFGSNHPKLPAHLHYSTRFKPILVTWQQMGMVDDDLAQVDVNDDITHLDVTSVKNLDSGC